MEENNKRIIKNTLYLYVRMLVIMALSFITTKIVLDKLGASDYGVYTLVGGFVSMFTVLNSILNTSTGRFIALYLGKGNEKLLKQTFSTAFFLHLAIAIVVVLALESIGLWFMNNNLNINADRMIAANWVFQFSVISTFLSVTQTPYSATVTAHERFNIYAMMSIFDVVAKIVILFLLVYIPGDKLIIYGALLLGVSLCNICIYRIYCMRHFIECRSYIYINKSILRSMLKFSGWGTFGHLITVINSQGSSIILNMFFNTVMNAARGLAHTVNFTIAQFISGFMTAAQPQLIKYYGAGDMKRFHKLIFDVTQYTLFLVAIMTVPVILEIDYVVGLWLGNNVPEYTCSFIKITMFCAVLYRSNSMIDSGIVAIGRVKELNCYSIPAYLLSLPLMYGVLWQGCNPIVAYWVCSIPPLIAFIINLTILRKHTQFPSGRFFIQIFIKNIAFILLATIIPYILQQYMEEGIYRFILVCGVSIVCTFTIIWLFGFNDENRKMFKEKVIGRFIKKYR